MRIARIILRVTDLEKSTEFWSETVGFSLEGTGGPFAFLNGGGVQLALNQVDEVTGLGSLTEIVLEADDFSGEYSAMLERGVPFEVVPRAVMAESDRELMAAHFRDPDGHLASLTGWVFKPV